MAIVIDARGLSCPQPVVLTNRALGESDAITTIVDNEAAKENVSRLARSKGFRVEIEEKDGLFYLQLSRDRAESEAVRPEGKIGSTVFLIGSDAVGRGSEELGQLLMRSFLHTLGEISPLPEKIIFLNTGVKLVVESSPVLEDLRVLGEKGIDILACGTCLGYFEIKDKLAIGQISNMYDIASALLRAGKVIEL
jgi:selenium metabolism protein YedF